MGEGNVQVLHRFIDAINAWDFDAMQRILADNIVFEMPFAPEGFPRRIDGRDNVLEFLSAVPDFIEPENLHDVTIHEFAEQPGELVAEYRSATRLKGTGQEYRNCYVVRATAQDGKLHRFAEFYDPIPLVLAMGGTVALAGSPPAKADA